MCHQGASFILSKKALILRAADQDRSSRKLIGGNKLNRLGWQLNFFSERWIDRHIQLVFS